MSDDINHKTQDEERIARLSAASGIVSPISYNPKYSTYIRWLRRILPVIALVIVAVVFAWGNMNDPNIIPAQDAHAPKTFGKNELLNPRFESLDKKNQPYTITAKRASQGESDDNLVMLEKPLADMMLNSGNWVAIKSKEGAFRQDTQRLFLRGDVELFHDRGYQMSMAELHIDLQANTAWSGTDVYGQGPAGTLTAKGLQANNVTGHLKFTGPAKLILTRTGKKANLKGSTNE